MVPTPTRGRMVAMTACAQHASAGFRPTAGLAWLTGFGAFGLSLSALYATTGVGVGCPFKMVTGWNCPLCGGTRLGSALLHGDLFAAFQYNALVFVGLAVLGVLGLLWSVEAVGGPRVRLPRSWSARLSAVHPTTWLIVGGAVAVAWTVLRNLL